MKLTFYMNDMNMMCLNHEDKLSTYIVENTVGKSLWYDAQFTWLKHSKKWESFPY